MPGKLPQIKRKYYWIGGIAAVIILGIILKTVAGDGATAVPNIKVARGTVVQEVSVTGKTKPVDSVNLAFERTGKVARIYTAVGARVRAGQVLVQLDAGDVAAQYRQQQAAVRAAKANLAQAAAGVESQQARLRDLQNSTQTDEQSSKQSLQSYYNNGVIALKNAYATADDVARVKLAPLFSGTQNTSYQLTYSTCNLQAGTDAANQRTTLEHDLLAWGEELRVLDASPTNEQIELALPSGVTHLNVASIFLERTSDTLNTGCASGFADTYRPVVNAARTSLNGAAAAVNNAAQAVSAQKLALQRLQNQFNINVAGSTADQVAMQMAAVKQAEASYEAQAAMVEQMQAAVQNIGAQLAKYTLAAPFAGLVTKQDATIGALAPAGTQLVSLISDDKLEVEANISEVDVGKVQIGNPVKITLDALAGEEFSGAVAYVNPAETIVDGVVNYKIKVLFAKFDPRFKSGLTANLAIETQRQENVLVLPQVTIMENDQGTFVKKLVNGKEQEVLVKLGVRALNGDTELLSGEIVVGDDLINIGFKAK